MSKVFSTSPWSTFVSARSSARTLAWALSIAAGACGDTETAAEDDTLAASSAELHAEIGPEGGTLKGEPGSAFEGVEVRIPRGALSEPVVLTLRPAHAEDVPLPETARACGPSFELAPQGLALAIPAEVTLPYDAAVVEDAQRLPEDVRVWVHGDEGWGRELALEASGDTVRFELGALGLVAAGVNPPKPEDVIEISLLPIAKNLPCIAQYPDDPSRAPTLSATVVRGDASDTMFIRGDYIAPELGFDLFSVERSNLDADGKPVPGFSGFGLAWYQTDLEANRWGRVRAVIRTVLLDEIFGFDPDKELAPTSTFHLGAWFNDPEAGRACGFDPSRPTPFNGEQAAGPLAFVTTPRTDTGLGPLCSELDDTRDVPTCKK